MWSALRSSLPRTGWASHPPICAAHINPFAAGVDASNVTRRSSAPPTSDVSDPLAARALAYHRWRGPLPQGWRTVDGHVHQLGSLRVSASLEELEAMDPGGIGAEQYLLVSLSRSDRKPPTPADVAVVQVAFCPAGVPIEVVRGGETRPMVFLSAILPHALAWIAAD